MVMGGSAPAPLALRGAVSADGAAELGLRGWGWGCGWDRDPERMRLRRPLSAPADAERGSQGACRPLLVPASSGRGRGRRTARATATPVIADAEDGADGARTCWRGCVPGVPDARGPCGGARPAPDAGAADAMRRGGGGGLSDPPIRRSQPHEQRAGCAGAGG